MNYEKSNGKRRKLYTSINNTNNGNQVHDAVLASQIRNINKTLKILEQSKVSCNDYDSTQQPFFLLILMVINLLLIFNPYLITIYPNH